MACRPVIGVLCCNEVVDRPVQVVASRFVAPLAQLSHATVLLVPAIADACDADALTERLDGLLLTGSRSHVSAERYGGAPAADDPLDAARDDVALMLADRMIEAGRPVFGICRGLQELNVLFGGSLARAPGDEDHYRRGGWGTYDDLFEHRHAVDLVAGGVLATATGERRLTVNSVHQQSIDRLGQGLRVEATADDGVIEAIAAKPCGGDVIGVQWHPEWDVGESAASRAFFALIGTSLRAQGGGG